MSSRNGTTVTELLVASTIVATLLTMIVPALTQTGRLCREMTRHRLALDELSNQLETLSLLPISELEARVESMSVDPLVAVQLPSAQLRGELVPEGVGHRLTLRLSWRRAALETPPITLSTWIFPVDPPADALDESTGDGDASQEDTP